MARPINSLVWATDIDVLGLDRTLARHTGYWVIKSPDNPTFWWGNFLLFDKPPGKGDGELWEALFEAENRNRPEVTHRAFAWDCRDGAIGDAEWELLTRGYELERTVGLTSTPARIRRHARANGDVEVRALDPRVGHDEELWEGAMGIWREQHHPGETDDYRETFLRRRQAGLREILRQGRRGAWYVALLDGQVVGSLGIVVTAGRARFQTVDTLEAHRGKGIATRLVADAGTDAAANYEIESFVIAADPDYHAIRIYESVGFERAESVVGALRKPAA